MALTCAMQPVSTPRLGLPFSTCRPRPARWHRQAAFCPRAVHRQAEWSPATCGFCAGLQQLAQRASQVTLALALSACIAVGGAGARMEGVNKPELLPKGDFTPVIDVAGFLTPGEMARIRKEVEALEKDTGVKLRVLAQNYPQTPGLAIKDYWGVDADTVVFVADPNTGNILNFNVGGNIDLSVPPSFWSRLAGKYGNKFYWQEKGQERAIVNAVSAIDSCLREPPGKFQCAKVQDEFEKF